MTHNAPSTAQSTNRQALALLPAIPGVCWILIFVLLPLALLLAHSFLSRNDASDPALPLSVASYARFFGNTSFGFDLIYPQLLVRTALLALLATAAGLMLATPVAFWIASLPSRWRTTALVLIAIPMWTNLVVRTYAWQLLLGPDTPLARIAESLGWAQPGEGLYPGLLAVLLGMTCDYLPFLVLPLYASVERIDWTLAEAAQDLGATPPQVFQHAILPQILPGVAAAAFLTFIPALGQFLIPDLLGGGKVAMLGNILQQQFGASNDWPFGAALTVMTLLSAVGLLILRKIMSAPRSDSDRRPASSSV